MVVVRTVDWFGGGGGGGGGPVGYRVLIARTRSY